MDGSRPLFIPVILGTARQGRMSEHVATLMAGEISKRPGVTTELIDIGALSLPTNDAGQAIRDSGFSEAMDRADGLVIVSPEYNHGYPGLLKHVLDSNYWEYVHKAVGVVAVSAGGFGGTRMTENLLPVLRALGMVPLHWDVNISRVHDVFDESGRLLDERPLKAIDKFLGELLWMATTLRHGRENIAVA